MTRVICDISMSLDGFIAGPNPTLEQPLGEGGEGLHEWAFRLASFRERHGMDGAEAGPDDDVMKESLAAQGAVVMGRRMFSGGAGPWEDDPQCGRLVGRRAAFSRTRVHPHPPRSRARHEARRNHVHVRHRRDRSRTRAGSRGRRRPGRLSSGRRRFGSAVFERRAARRAPDPPCPGASRRGRSPSRQSRRRKSGWSSTGWSIRRPSRTSGTGSLGPRRASALGARFRRAGGAPRP
jgi:dihydrofolate reductase